MELDIEFLEGFKNLLLPLTLGLGCEVFLEEALQFKNMSVALMLWLISVLLFEFF